MKDLNLRACVSLTLSHLSLCALLLGRPNPSLDDLKKVVLSLIHIDSSDCESC